MNYLYRQRAFLILEQFPTIQETKDNFAQKIQNILNQYLIIKNVIDNNNEILDKFKESIYYLLIINIKQLEALYFLSTNNDVEWKILTTFIDDRNYFLNIPNNIKKEKNIKVLNIDEIGNYQKKFFYILKKYYIIDSNQWEKLDFLQSYRDNVSLAHLNDYLFDQKLFNEEDIQKFKNDQPDLTEILNKPLKLRKFSTDFWQFIVHLSNNSLIVEKLLIKIIKMGDYDFYKISEIINEIKNHQNLLCETEDFSNIIQKDENENWFLLDMLLKILKKAIFNIGYLNEVFEHFFLLNIKNINNFMSEIFIYILNNQHFHKNNVHTKRTDVEKLLHAQYSLDLLFYILDNKINIKQNWNNKIEECFKSFCEIEFQVLKNNKIINKLKVQKFYNYINIKRQIYSLIKQQGYNNNFKKYVDHYFIGFLKNWKNYEKK